MKKSISDELRSVDVSEVPESVFNTGDDFKKRILDRTLIKTGLKARERNRSMKKLSWQKIAALAACLCIAVCAVVFCVSHFGGKPPVIDKPSGIRGDFMGLRMLKAYVDGDTNPDDFVYELAVMENLDMTAEEQCAVFEAMGIRTAVASEYAILIYPTKAQVLAIELPESMQFTQFNMLSENK